MNAFYRKGAAGLTMIMLCGYLAGCSNAGGSPETGSSSGTKPSEQEMKQPEEFAIVSALSEADFKSIFTEPLSKKFPNVRFQQINPSGNGVANLLSTSTSMDLIQYGITNLMQLVELDLPANLDPMVKKYGYNLNRFDSNAIASIRSYSSTGELLVLPYTYQPFVLHYNKDLFDKFGIDYPKAGNTWDDLITLARKLSRVDGGVEYHGLSAGLSINRMQSQLSLPYVDSKTSTGLIATHPGWSKLFRTYGEIYGIPNNLPPSKKPGNPTQEFVADKILAMYPHLISLSFDNFAKAVQDGMKMGVTTFPVFADAPDIGTGFFGGGVVIPKNSRYPDFAFQIIQYMTSDEVQIEYGKIGMASPLTSAAVRNKLFEGNPIAHKVQLDLDVIYRLKLAKPYPQSNWDAKALSLTQTELNKFIAGQTDINTALKQADEQINKWIKENSNK